MKKNAIFTIISKNYISYARVLMDSFLKYHSDCDCYVLLADKVDDYFDPLKEKFRTTELEQVEIPNRDAFIFKYDIMELNTAVKPFFFEYLFRNCGYEKVIYFDPDILILRELSHLFEILDSYSFILIPHFTSPIPDDGKHLSEIDIMKVGCYNLGFIGLANYGRVRGFLGWWQDRLLKYCFSAPEAGLFVDQKWVDLVPSMYDDVHILRHPGYNVAYWNLHERKIGRNNGEYYANSEPLFFFHFSGINLHHLEIISQYQNRFKLDDIENLRSLFETYKNLVMEKGYPKTKDWPYFYAFFDNSAKIPNIVRHLYHSLGEKTKAFGNPFAASGEKSFFHWLNAPFNPRSRITNLLFYIYTSRLDLQNVFPEIKGKGEERLIRWAFSSLPREYGIEKIFLKPLRKTKKINPAPVTVSLIIEMSFYENLLWKYGIRYAALIKRIPWLKEIAEKKFIELYRKRVELGYERSSPGVQNQIRQSKGFGDITVPDEIGVNVAGYLDTESGVGEAARRNDQKS